jgi:DNA-binding NtrC family response regulator
MVMPGGLTGRQLAVELRRTRPDLKLLFVSGYSPSRGGSDINVLEGMRFIPKPYQADQILAAIREQLDSKTATENTSFRRRLAKHASTELCA